MTSVIDERLAVSASRMDNAEFAITTDSLTKRFGDVAVVDQLDLRVPSGSVFGFLGPNGSGKTTTIRMLLGLISANEGSVGLFGQSMPEATMEILPAVGALVEGPACYPWLTGRQNLERIDAAGPHGDAKTRPARIELALERVGLSAAQHKKFKAYSLGMRQRLGLAQALLRPRRLLILDEPTNGMDPQGTREIRHLIRELAADGTTVFLSSHLLAEVEQVCTHVAMMRLGKLVTQGSLAALQGATTSRVQVRTTDPELATAILRGIGLDATHSEGVVVADLGTHRAEDLCRQLVEGGVGVREFAIHQPSLEDTFVSLTGEGFDVTR
ncbi:MAG: type transport system ATP-binding protein [Ilumatobacteraceae bacterium]|jgi:ABC-2 type transport system ATP-binding protein